MSCASGRFQSLRQHLWHLNADTQSSHRQLSAIGQDAHLRGHAVVVVLEIPAMLREALALLGAQVVIAEGPRAPPQLASV